MGPLCASIFICIKNSKFFFMLDQHLIYKSINHQIFLEISVFKFIVNLHFIKDLISSAFNLENDASYFINFI
jgi:hypothetical protein